MKLSEMNTIEASNAILRMAQPASNLMQDDEVYKLFEQLAAEGAHQQSMLHYIGGNIVPIATVAFKSHRDDLIEIIAALTGKTVRAIKEQKFTQTIADIKGSLDKELLDFFSSSAGSTGTAEGN